MKKKQDEMNIVENPLYHDTWKLLKKYRDVVWSLELSVQQVRNRFEIEYGNSIEDFLESVYLAGADLSGSDIEHHAKCIVTILSFLRSNSGMWRKSLKSCGPISETLAFAPTIGEGRRR